eukprot:TRINITY_DN2885_c0_g1_i1.p1 TRINITY_DN2885_c0_g1~~TRINITY_DN2885_c0_g1_i1.p1  ORF type:complete len:496 (+),score=38.90 TRINITY_DN2885_c0_g1_i1:63-1550(+)
MRRSHFLLIWILFFSFCASDQHDNVEKTPVVWMAPVFSGGGYSSEAITYVLSLKELGVDVSILQHGDQFSHKFLSGLDEGTKSTLRSMVLRKYPSAEYQEHAIIICHSEPGAWHHPKFQTLPCPPVVDFPVGFLIGRTMFETDRLPNGWAERLNAMDQVWVPTNFSRDVFVKYGVREDKLVVVPESVNVTFFDPNRPGLSETARTIYASASAAHFLPSLPSFSPSASASLSPSSDSTSPPPIVDEAPSPLSSSHRPFRFLSVFKWEERKGWQILIEAYVREFLSFSSSNSSAENTGDQRTVELYILTNAYHTSSDFHQKIKSFIDASLHDLVNRSEVHFPPIFLLSPGLPTSLMPAVYKGADCFVLPSRGEGFGRPHVEAMASALPVISTFWSGPTQYMTENNSFPLRIDGMDTILSGPFAGHSWARPSLQHLRQLMRHVYSHRAEAQQKGQQARNDMLQKYCPRCVAVVIKERLLAISAMMTKKFHDYVSHDEV